MLCYNTLCIFVLHICTLLLYFSSLWLCGFARQSNRCDDSSETKEQDVFSSHLLCVHVVSHDTVHRKYNFARPC